jgi:cardiolipin synthase A/B
VARRGRRRRLARYLRPVLRPGLGHRLPPELTARRIGSIAGALPDGVHGTGLETLLRRVEAKPIHAGNQVELFRSGGHAFTAMYEAVAGAHSEVLLESYIFKDDQVGRTFLELLAAAVQRGVTVRVLADALGSFGTHVGFWRDMARRGITTHLFNPLFKGLWYQPFRDHRKLLVVDRRIAFTGGMNIAVEYGSAGWPLRRRRRRKAAWHGGPTAWRDSHVRVVGPAAWALAVVFSEGWEHAGGEPLQLPPLAQVTPPAPPVQEALAAGAAPLAGRAELAHGSAGEGGDHPAAHARVLVLDAQPLRGNREAAASLAAIAAAARQRLWITNAYFAPGHSAVRILADAAARGVDVRLLLPGTTDVPLVRHAGHGYFAGLLRRGIRIFEYQATVLHAKSLVADGYVSVVGSTNLDFRSFLFNAECNLVVFDAAFAMKLERAFAADLAHSVEITQDAWNRRSAAHRAGDRLARLLSPLL